MILNITPIKQKDENSCFEACLSMVFSYYNQNITPGEIDSFVIRDAKRGSFITEDARFAVTKGFSVDCYSYNLLLIDPYLDKHKSKDELISKLDTLKGTITILLKKKKETNDPRIYYLDEDLQMLDSTIKAIESGVNFLIKRPSSKNIINYLQKNIPVIVTVSYAALHDKQGNPYMGHDIVVNGIEGDEQIYFIDPSNGVQEHTNIKNLMFAISQRKIIGASAYMLAIYK